MNKSAFEPSIFRRPCKRRMKRFVSLQLRPDSFDKLPVFRRFHSPPPPDRPGWETLFELEEFW